MLKGFKQFILRGNVVDLAVGVVIGAAFGKIVDALVKDLVTPLIGSMFRAPDFSGMFFTVNDSKFMIGDFINVLVSFLIIAFTIYFFVVIPVNRLIARANKNKKTEDPTTKKCPQCLSEIPVEAKRCAFCTERLGE